MPKSAAERQAALRRRRPYRGENGERRLTAWVPTSTALALKRLARREGVTQEQVLERLIGTADDAIVATLELRTPEWDEYFDVSRPRRKSP